MGYQTLEQSAAVLQFIIKHACVASVAVPAWSVLQPSKQLLEKLFLVQLLRHSK